MGKHHPSTFPSDIKLDVRTLDQFASVRAYFGSKHTIDQIAMRLDISRDVVLEIFKRSPQNWDVALKKSKGIQVLSIEEIKRRQEPVGCRTVHGDIKKDLDWFRCQKPLKKGGRCLFCDDCYSRFVKIG